MKKQLKPSLSLINEETGQIYQSMDMALDKTKEFFTLHFTKTIDSLYNTSGIKINHSILNHMLLNMDNENIIMTGEYFKTKLSQKSGLSKRTIVNCIYDLEKTGLIKKIAMNEYIVNPNYFGRGSIKQIKKLRLEYELINLDYENPENKNHNLNIKYEVNK